MRQLAYLLFLSLLFPLSAFGQSPASGEFLAGENCPAFQSIRKQTNPGELSVQPGQSYRVLAENKPGGDWFLLEVEEQRRWVEKRCGQHQGQPALPAARADSATADFDFYTLAMSWHSGFCNGRSRPDCRGARGDLVLHGLWPSSARGAHPAFCDGSEKQRFCGYGQLTLNSDTREQLDGVMPGSKVCLDRYQWHKHGSCSGLDEQAYFEQSVAYSQWLRQSPPANKMRVNSGGSVSRAAVLDWFSDWGFAGAVSLHCKNGYLEEVRVYLQPDLPASPEQAKPRKFGGQQRCPARFDLLP
ncbi:ribonuclease T2 family protein [Ferrimonas balearica]|uniref:ribonuclease T2 family protein n=1 Tax=Ferrimonas balearica TaxID=44012 RepID=UPI001C994BF4|nr:hypothetical protein [Ferrimonas balearica]MBY5922053.1 hypothetical protein [Ferrimonas balearica]MBY5994607.1 hypothetical protein [Ferrimonas balearica]